MFLIYYRIARFEQIKNFEQRILVTTDLFARGIDVSKINVVINFDMPEDADCYLHRVGRAGRFGTKGLAISFVSTEEDATVLNDVQKRFVVSIPTMPAEIDCSVYSEYFNRSSPHKLTCNSDREQVNRRLLANKHLIANKLLFEFVNAWSYTKKNWQPLILLFLFTRTHGKRWRIPNS